MAMLQLIIRNYSRRIIGFLCFNCILVHLLTLNPTQSNPPKTNNFVSQSDRTRTVGGPDPCPTMIQRRRDRRDEIRPTPTPTTHVAT